MLGTPHSPAELVAHPSAQARLVHRRFSDLPIWAVHCPRPMRGVSYLCSVRHLSDAWYRLGHNATGTRGLGSVHMSKSGISSITVTAVSFIKVFSRPAVSFVNEPRVVIDPYPATRGESGLTKGRIFCRVPRRIRRLAGALATDVPAIHDTCSRHAGQGRGISPSMDAGRSSAASRFRPRSCFAMCRILSAPAVL